MTKRQIICYRFLGIFLAIYWLFLQFFVHFDCIRLRRLKQVAILVFTY
jgi:hypothetical protein